MKTFDGKRVFITGGSSGIGLDLAKQFASLGAHIMLVARTPDKLNAALKEVQNMKRSESQLCITMPLDVVNLAEVSKAMQRAVAEFGPPDILISNAGVSYAAPFADIPPEEFDKVIQINLYGARNVIAELLPFMKDRGGSIVVMASLAGLLGIYGYSAYCASKYALVGLAECLRSELKYHNIALTLVCPPEVDTPLVEWENTFVPPETKMLKKMAGLLKPEYVAHSVIAGIRKKKFLVIPGFRAKYFYYLQRFSPAPLSRLIQDNLIKISRRKGHN